jgi:hypothetical protein
MDFAGSKTSASTHYMTKLHLKFGSTVWLWNTDGEGGGYIFPSLPILFCIEKRGNGYKVWEYGHNILQEGYKITAIVCFWNRYRFVEL